MVSLEIPSRITYEINGYNLGDNLLSYIRGKWLSMHYNIPLFYKPFPFANQFGLHGEEKKKFNPLLLDKFEVIHPISNELEICFEDPSNILYVLPCYSESQCGINDFDDTIPFLEIDWEDKSFRKALKKSLKPTNAVPEISISRQRLSVAVYLPDRVENDSPLQSPPDSYYIEQIQKLSNLLYNRPLFVYLFTENRNGNDVLNAFKKAIPLNNILFECKRSNKMTRNSYVEDFINMGKFDCLIRPSNNLGFLLEQINDYLISIRPIHHHIVNNVIIIDQIYTKTRKN